MRLTAPLILLSGGGGNSLIINELDQKLSDFTEDLLKQYSGGTKALNAFMALTPLVPPLFCFLANYKQTIKNH